MQTYSKNLEALVEDRSKQLLEEKQRTDALLHSKRLLPYKLALSANTLKSCVFTKYTSFIHTLVTAAIPSKLLLSKKPNKQTNKKTKQITATNEHTPTPPPKKKRRRRSNLVLYAQSTSAVISGRENKTKQNNNQQQQQNQQQNNTTKHHQKCTEMLKQIIVIMEICKAPTLRLKCTITHDITTHIQPVLRQNEY